MLKKALQFNRIWNIFYNSRKSSGKREKSTREKRNQKIWENLPVNPGEGRQAGKSRRTAKV